MGSAIPSGVSIHGNGNSLGGIVSLWFYKVFLAACMGYRMDKNPMKSRLGLAQEKASCPPASGKGPENTLGNINGTHKAGLSVLRDIFNGDATALADGL